jgi:hypothetical protein
MVKKELMAPTIALLLIVTPQKWRSIVHSYALFFLDSDGYFFLKTDTNSFFHQFHARRDHISTLTTLLDENDKNQIQQDLSSA